MNTSLRNTILFLCIAVPFTAIALSGVAHAAPEPAPQTAGQALEIAPPVITLKAEPGQRIEAKIDLRDVSSSPLVVTSTIDDFTAGGEDGSPKIDVEKKEPSPYSIISWVSPLPKLNLKPRAIEKLPVVIQVPANAAPGGYYGVVRFSATAPNLQDTGVSLSASLGALIFIRVNGDAEENMELVDFYAEKENIRGWMFESHPIKFVERIKNTGNVYEQPVGSVLIKDMFGKEVASLNVNLDQRNVLPGSTRKFTTDLDKAAIGDRILFGPYTAELVSKYGAKEQTVSKKITFWVIPWSLIFGALILIGLIIGIIVFVIRRSTDRIVKKSRSSRRR